MGFFALPVAPPKKVRESVAKQQQALDPSKRGCDVCSLRDRRSTIISPMMRISGSKSADILILGEAPGEHEDRDGCAFVGPSGNVLRRLVPGRDIDRLAFQNTIRCHPHNNATPSVGNVHACGLYLEEDIEALPLKAIIGVGAVPLAKFYPGQNITRIHGVKFPIKVGNKLLWYFPVMHPAFALRTGAEKSSAMYCLQADIRQFFKDIDKWPTPTIYDPNPNDVLLPKSEEEARFYLSEMRGALGVDLETQKLKPYLLDSSLLTAAISDGITTMAFPIDHPEAPTSWGLRLLLEVCSTRQWIAHNAAFELVWMLWMAQEADIDFLPFQFDDSMALGRLYHKRETVLSLEMMTRIHLGTDVKSVSHVNLNNMIEEPLERVLPYNGLDAQASALLFRLLRDQVNAVNYYRFIETIHSTARMELIGLETDPEESDSLRKTWQDKNDKARIQSASLYEVQEFERQNQREFNIASPQDLGEALVIYGKAPLPKTSKKGEDGKMVDGAQWSTDDDSLREHASDNPLALAAIDFRESKLLVSTFIDGVIRHCNESKDRKIHPSYTSMHTATTRLSCTDPNAQNFPKRRHMELRKQVVPDRKQGKKDSTIFLAVDMGQIDARIYGCATKDRNLCKSFIDRVDIHSKWRDAALKLFPEYLDRLARKTNESDEKRILKGARDIIKSDFVFASFYGSPASACADRTGIPLPISTELVGQFWHEYPDAGRWLKLQRQQYANTGTINTLCGVERHGLLWGNEVINTPIQGTTAHVVNDAQNALSRLSIEHDDPYLHPRINIHDDLTFVVPNIESRIEEYIELIANEMVKVRYNWQIVPFTVECKIGRNWADLEEVCVIEGAYNR